ncbi:MAG: hypothetical protein ACUVXI_12320 [bacterium]
MRIFINGSEIDFELEEESSIREVLRSLEGWLFERGEVMTTIFVNGEIYTAEQREKGVDMPLDVISTLEVNSKRPGRLALESIYEVGRYLIRLQRGVEEIAELWRSGEEEKAFEMFHQFTEGMEWITQALHQAALILKLDYSRIEIDGNTVESKSRELLDISKSILEASSNKDIIALSDILEYEMVPQIGDWINIVDGLIEYIEREKLAEFA